MNKKQSYIDNQGQENFPDLLRARGVTLKQIRYFLAVAHKKSVTSAASDIYISPAAITEAVKNLENALGVSLFERGRAGMLLTREGDRFYGYCEKILFLLNDAMRAVNKSCVIEGNLRIAASPVVLGYFLPSILSRFQHMFPGIHVNLLELERKEIEQMVACRALDVGILLVSNVTKNAKFLKRELFSSPRVLWCAASHSFATKESVSLADIAGEPYIQLLIDEAEENTIKFWKKSGLSPKIVLRTETTEAVRGYVGQGTGVTILSKVLFRSWSLEGDRIIAKPIVEYIPAMDVGVIWAHGELPSAAKTFLDFMFFQDWQRNVSGIRKNRKGNSKD